jgi:hypothetical protein
MLQVLQVAPVAPFPLLSSRGYSVPPGESEASFERFAPPFSVDVGLHVCPSNHAEDFPIATKACK